MSGTGITSRIHWDGQHFFFRGPQGQPLRVTREAEAVLLSFLDLFRMRFGRDPGPGDPVVFDVTKSTLTPMPIEDMEESMRDILIDMAAHQDVPPPPVNAMSISPVRPPFRLAYPYAPEYAVVQEALAHVVYLEDEAQKLVIAVLMMEKEGAGPKRPFRLYYWHTFISARRASGHRFDPTWAIRAPTLYQFQRPAQTGWVPVAIAYGDDGPDCAFVPILAGVALTGAKLDVVYETAAAALRAARGAGRDR
jgi:hypothetical protein